MAVTAVVVNYHTRSMVESLINDLAGESLVEAVILVDNSGECRDVFGNGETKFGKKILPEFVKHVAPQKNIGFGAGVNRGVTHVKSDWILVINPDMKVPPGAVLALVQGAREVGAVLAGPRFFWDDDMTFRLPPALGGAGWMDYALASQACYQLDAEYLSFFWQIRHDRFWSTPQPFVEPFLSGACMLVDRRWAASRFSAGQGVFDPRFFMYYEDTDLAARACLEGNPPVCVPASVMIHYYNQSPEAGVSKSQMMAHSQTLFRERYYPDAPVPKPLASAGYRPACVDLGVISPGHGFVSADGGTEGLFFEIGVSPFFVPFIQLPLLPGLPEGVVLPGAVWDRLVPGTYFARFRSQLKGVKEVWQWRKK